MSSHECPVCLEPYSDAAAHQPRALNCGHTLCDTCCRDILKMKGKVVTCPVCRKDTKPNKGGVATLPVIYALIPNEPASPPTSPPAAAPRPAAAAAVRPPPAAAAAPPQQQQQRPRIAPPVSAPPRAAVVPAPAAASAAPPQPPPRRAEQPPPPLAPPLPKVFSDADAVAFVKAKWVSRTHIIDASADLGGKTHALRFLSSNDYKAGIVTGVAAGGGTCSAVLKVLVGEGAEEEVEATSVSMSRLADAEIGSPLIAHVRTTILPQAAAAEVPADQWACQVCTLLNNLSTPRCGACASPRQPPANGSFGAGTPVFSPNGSAPQGLGALRAAAAVAAAGWVCQVCTLHNSAEARHCAMCGRLGAAAAVASPPAAAQQSPVYPPQLAPQMATAVARNAAQAGAGDAAPLIAPPPEGKPSNQLYIKGVPEDVKASQLAPRFAPGTLKKFKLSKSKTGGVLTFGSIEEAEAALRMGYLTIAGNRCQLERVKRRSWPWPARMTYE